MRLNYKIPFIKGLFSQNYQNSLDFMFANVTAWGKAYNRSFWLKNKISFAEDVFFEDNIADVKVFAFAQKVLICPHDFYYYRLRGNSITQSFSDKKIDDFFFSLLQMADFLKTCSFYAQIKEKFEKFCHNSIQHHLQKIPEDKKQNVLKRFKNFQKHI